MRCAPDGVMPEADGSPSSQLSRQLSKPAGHSRHVSWEDEAVVNGGFHDTGEHQYLLLNKLISDAQVSVRSTRIITCVCHVSDGKASHCIC